MARERGEPRMSQAQVDERLADIEKMFNKDNSERDTGDFTGFDPESNAQTQSTLTERSITRIMVIKQNITESFQEGSENREELKDEARESLKKAGRSALEVGKKAVRVSVGIDLLVMEAAGKAATYVRKKLTLFASQARTRVEKRVKARRDRKTEARRQQRLAEETEAYQMHDEWTAQDEAEQRAFQEAQEINQGLDAPESELDEAYNRNQEMDAEATRRDHDSAQEFHRERLSVEAELRAEAERSAREAKARKAVRKARRTARRRERLANFVGRISNSKIGRAAKRAARAVATGARAAKASWDTQQ